MLTLKPHNQKTYTALCELFSLHDRAAVVQPTGTGKSFIILRLIEDNPTLRFLVAAPSAYIFMQIKSYAEEYGVNIGNVSFATYPLLAKMTQAEASSLRCDYIVLDEFHRCGAEEWGRGVCSLLAAHPKSKILGTSATPIRYLDNLRNMAEELFENRYAVNMSLAEAIRLKILPVPIYVTTWYAFSGELARLEARAQNSDNPRVRMALLGRIAQAKRRLTELDCGLDGIFAKHIRNASGKYIVFCPDIERLNKCLDECDGWFRRVNGCIHKYIICSDYSDSERDYESFESDGDSAALKLLFCVNMINEGVHINDIDGVIMLRATQSGNIFYQQLGRALACSGTRNPIIFDIVNNYQTGDTAKQYSQIMELGGTNGAADDGDMELQLYDYVQDIREILNGLSASFESSWEIVFEALREFMEKFARTPFYDEKYDGLRLGVWCSNQRIMYRSGRLSEERAARLESIGFRWDRHEERWQEQFNRLCEWKNRYGRFPTASDRYGEENGTLYSWMIRQRFAYNQGRLPDEYAQQLSSIGFSFEIVRHEDSWEQRYAELCEFVRKNGRFPTLSDKRANGEIAAVYKWMSYQKAANRHGTLDADRKRRLDEIGFIWDKSEAVWSNSFEQLRAFVAENSRTPKPTEKYNGCAVGQWYYKQRRLYLDSKLPAGRRRRLAQVSADFADSN